MKNFFVSIWSAINRISSYGIITVILGLILWFITPYNIYTKLLIAIILILLFIIAAMSKVAFDYYIKANKNILPEVLYVSETPKSSKDNNIQILLGPSNLFSIDTLVSFYYKNEDNFELLIGFGVVINIQQDMNIQVSILHFLKEHKEIYEKIITNKANELKKILVKPNIPKLFIDRKYGGF